jgi:hypothetical protein
MMRRMHPLKRRDAPQIHEPREMSFLKKWQYPEVALFKSPKEAAQAFARSPWSHKWVWLVVIASGAGPLLLGRLPEAVPPFLGVPKRLIFTVYCISTFLLALLWNVTIWGLWFVFVHKPIRRHLRGCLVAQGIPICVECGYDVRGQLEPRCPECGTAFEERLLQHDATDPRTPNQDQAVPPRPSP